MGVPVKAIRGILANIEAGLVLKFQFNPPHTSTTKEVNYHQQGIPGWDHPDIIFEHGGVKKIKFDLWFDRTEGSEGTGFENIGIPLAGTEGVKSILESFLYPQRDLLSFVGGPPKFTAPPRGLLVLGFRFFEVIVEGGQEMKDALLNKLLTPVRLHVPMSFIIIEEGKVNEIQVAKRQALALAQSAISTAEVVAEIFSSGGAALLSGLSGG